MRILALNTATNLTEIALVDGEKVLYEKSWDSDYNEAEKVLPALKEALKDGEPLDGIFVVQGPGAFTGLRIGVTIANVTAYAAHVPLYTCDTFDYLRLKIKPKFAKDTAVVLKAGGGFLASSKDETIQEMPSAKYILSDVKEGEKEKYPLWKGSQLLPVSGQKKLSQCIDDLIKNFPTKHKIVKPYYLNPPQITKSKKECYT